MVLVSKKAVNKHVCTYIFCFPSLSQVLPETCECIKTRMKRIYESDNT